MMMMTMMLTIDENENDNDNDDNDNYKSNFFESRSKVILSHNENLPPSPSMNCSHILVLVFMDGETPAWLQLSMICCHQKVSIGLKGYTQ
jgi:hypothetical protein